MVRYSFPLRSPIYSNWAFKALEPRSETLANLMLWDVSSERVVLPQSHSMCQYSPHCKRVLAINLMDSGSIKANIGHLEGGSGLAGILKCIMILEKGIIPPNPLFEKMNPSINAKFYNIQVNPLFRFYLSRKLIALGPNVLHFVANGRSSSHFDQLIWLRGFQRAHHHG